MRWRIDIERRGRTGSVTYTEAGNAVRYDAELGGGPAVLIVAGPPPQDWDAQLSWAAGRRREITSRVAVAVQASELPNATFSFGDDYSTIVFTPGHPAQPRDHRVDSTIRAALVLPIAFRLQNTSAHQIAIASGYLECRGFITTTLMREHIGRNPGLVSEWIRWSEDKRVSEGWYFESALFCHVVGYFADRAKHTVRRFVCPTAACAYFAMRELDQLVGVGR